MYYYLFRKLLFLISSADSDITKMTVDLKQGHFSWYLHEGAILLFWMSSNKQCSSQKYADA